MSTCPSNSPAPSSSLRAAARLARLLLYKLWLTLTFYPRLWRTRSEEDVWRLGEEFTHRWCRMGCRTLGLRLHERGGADGSGFAKREGGLIAPNHQSYADIVVIGALRPCFFISKAEVGRWPIIGFMLRRSMNLLIQRGRKRDLMDAGAQITRRLRAGHAVCVFLEGTTSGGDGILPFRPGLAEAPIEAGVPVVPVFICYRPAHPGVSVPADVAYWNNYVFGPHAWRLMGLPGGIDVDVWFGAPVRPEGHDRKSLAAAAREEIVKLREVMLRGGAGKADGE